MYNRVLLLPSRHANSVYGRRERVLQNVDPASHPSSEGDLSHIHGDQLVLSRVITHRRPRLFPPVSRSQP